MAKWKELGEVPDSDDESTWDSQESLPNRAVTANDADPPDIGTDRESQAIWDIPLSSQVSIKEVHALPSPKPEAPKPRFLDLSNEDTERESSPLSSLSEEDYSTIDDAPSTAPFEQHHVGSEEPRSSPPSLEQFAREEFEFRDIPTVQGIETTDNGNSRLGRSLRPRKPIQEHPYLLESAQYSKQWKSHGLRPVRVSVEEESRRRQEEYSQEQDFEDDSQVTNNDTIPEESEESQAIGHLDTIFELNDGLNDVSLSDDGEPSPPHESRAQSREQSPPSSQGDDELPDPNDVEKWKIHKTARRVRKRHASPKASLKRKLSKQGKDPAETAKHTLILPDIDDIFDTPVSPPRTSPAVLAVTPMAVVNRLGGPSVAAMTPKPSSNISSRIHSPAPAHQHSQLIDLTMLDNGDSDGDSENDIDAADSPTVSEREPDEVRLGARRIRGVLPASWLRLDQQTAARKAKATTRHRSPVLSPERSAKKGVAQRRITSIQQGIGSALFLSDDSEDSDSTVRPQAPNISFPDIFIPIGEDDAASVIEEDHIDHMFSRNKMASTGSSRPQKKRKRGQQSTFSGQPGQRKRQQRITGILNRTKSVPRAQDSHVQASESSAGSHRAKKRNTSEKKPSSRPVPLGILDVVEVDAPAFIRIAARTASKRRDKGRSSPSKKVIMLGTRQDTIDAVGVLNRWKEGLIQPRDTASFSSRPQPRRALVHKTTQELVSQTSTPRRKPVNVTKPSTRFAQPRRMIKQTSMDSFVNVGAQDRPELNPRAGNLLIERPRLHDPFCRPAQLEMSGNSLDRNTFTTQKRALDALWRKSRKSLPTSGHLHLEQTIGRQIPEGGQLLGVQLPHSPENNSACKAPGTKRRTRYRKQIRPQPVDVSTPQYTHANDPLPRELSPPTTVADSKNEATGKLLGLAPYGTHYTQHFEIFPLDRGVYFHESTIIGSGRLKMALDGKSLGSLSTHRGWCTFTLDEQPLRWGPWSAQTSSEIGIIFDWVIDRLDHESSGGSQLGATIPAQATDFILLYLQNHLSLTGSDTSDIFVGRLIDVLKGFERRLQESPGIRKHTTQSCIETLTRILVILVQVLRLCQKLEKVSEAFQVEEILKRIAAITAELLFQTSLKEVQDMYGNLQQLSFRERGLRNEEYSVICWVTIIRILEEVRLPRAGFWGVISSVLLSPCVDSTVEVTVFERAWRSVFTLLPLGEFDNTGVATPGIRYSAPLEGWTIAQRLLRRIIDLYKNNSRQSPSFNDYLRALMSRCHYLVEQWGWDKCNAILGTIFDFFAGQEFHNLRNEEVYQSPQFLEELSDSPSLATFSEDRCFHIYLKLVAMSIKRLEKSGLVKEIKNLVARLLPNHSRQYDKMMATYEAEIAALRNHHDLLCTLFWAAPSELRPSVQSIEGLVAIKSSHKEACLINLRACSRLSRFVVSSCEDISTYKPLADWQRSISQQVLEQFLSVESEVNQQLLGMSAEACGKITQEHRNAVISKNKRVAMDLLHFSMRAFLDTMRHTQTLGAASSVLNNYPLEQVLTRLSFSSADSDWGILQVALDILDYFLTRIDNFASAEPLHVGQSWHEEDAIMLLERKFSSPLMSVVRGVINLKSQGTGLGQVGDREVCVEAAVTLAGRIGACLIHARLARFRQFFQAGKYHLFDDISKPTVSNGRKYVALFLAIMADRGVTDFKDIGFTPLDLFLAEMTKPLDYIAYENRLATSFKRLGETYLESAVIEVGNTPDYSSNRDLFNYTITSMRYALLQANVDQKPQLQNTFSKALRLTMDRMKTDLRSMTLNSPGHLNYVKFVRLVISHIRSQDLCPVDPFFYQISPEYSPSREDPRLETAGILSWGLKLEEGESKAISGLFYLLFPSFKIALANGELAKEVTILKEGMKNGHVFDFILSTMLPAIIRTAAKKPEGCYLLETYIDAIDARLSEACVHQVIGGDLMKDILAMHKIVLAAAEDVQTRPWTPVRIGDIMSLVAMMKLLNLLSPSVTAFLINEPESPTTKDFAQVIKDVDDFTRAADAYLSELVEDDGMGYLLTPDPSRLFEGLGLFDPEAKLRNSEHVDRFSSHMIQDIRNNWVSGEGVITVKAPARSQRPSATQSGQGTLLHDEGGYKALSALREQMRTWNRAHGVITNTASDGALIDEILF